MSALSFINNNFESYQALITFYNENKNKFFSQIHLDLRQFFAANMSSVLGAVLDKFAGNVNEIVFDNISPEIEQILSKNQFLSFYGHPRITDNKHTTIKFQKLKPTDGKYFKSYVIEELIGRNELPKMSEAVKEKVVEAIYEIFVNAQIHSDTSNIYTCGQFFPHKNEIEFTIVDIGIGFKEKVNRRFNSNISSVQAIKWAIMDRNTTKTNISGGIGLSVLKEFIDYNKGKMQIVSDDGFYQFDKNGERTGSFKGGFPGTVVNLQFRTDDNGNYILKSELDANNIF